MSVMKKATAIVAGSLFMLGAVAGPAQAQHTVQDGLINVRVGNITITDAIDINAAASIAATLCDIADVSNVAVLGVAVDQSGKKETVCRTESGPVRLVNNR